MDPRTGHVFLAVQNGTSSSILMLSDRTNKIIARIKLAVSPQTRTMYAAVVCDPGSWVSGVSEKTGRIAATIDADGAFRSMAADPHRNVVFAVNYISGDVMVIDARTNKVTSTPAVGVHPGAVTVNPATGRAYIANSSRTVSVLAPTGVSARRAGGSDGATSGPLSARPPASAAELAASPASQRAAQAPSSE